MIDTSKDGGPAFPCEWDYIGTSRASANGMSLRDYFAAKALAGMLADSEVKATREDFAERSYALADAMILERNK